MIKTLMLCMVLIPSLCLESFALEADLTGRQRQVVVGGPMSGTTEVRNIVRLNLIDASELIVAAITGQPINLTIQITSEGPLGNLFVSASNIAIEFGIGQTTFTQGRARGPLVSGGLMGEGGPQVTGRVIANYDPILQTMSVRFVQILEKDIVQNGEVNFANEATIRFTMDVANLGTSTPLRYTGKTIMASNFNY